MNATLNSTPLLWVLEDEEECRFVYEKTLSHKYQLIFFESIAEFSDALQSDLPRPSLIVADLILGDGNFINYLTESKEAETLEMPFIVVSSIDDIDALRFCFEEGALDYLTKPFKKNEILVKIENILSGRASRSFVESEPRTLNIDGTKITNLTSKQIQVLSLFLNSSTRTINRNDIMQKVWGDTTVHPKTIDVHLYNLRRKLNPHGYLIRSEGGGNWILLSGKIS